MNAESKCSSGPCKSHFRNSVRVLMEFQIRSGGFYFVMDRPNINPIFVFLFSLTVCSENSCLSERFHVGLWSGKRWTCCRLSNRSADGCDSCTSWSRTASTLGLNRNEPVESINNNPAALARLAGKLFVFTVLYFRFNNSHVPSSLNPRMHTPCRIDIL